MKKEDKIKKLLEHYAQAIFIAIFKCRPHFLAAPYVRKLGNWACSLGATLISSLHRTCESSEIGAALW